MSKLRCDPAPPKSPAGRLHHRSGGPGDPQGQHLTPVLIQQQYLARWDGRLPQYAFGGNAVPFVQLPGASGDSGRR